MVIEIIRTSILACAMCLLASTALANECLSRQERERLLALHQDAFDQDMQGGWRVLEQKPGCRETAANLIAEWRQRHQSTDTIVFWHEGQARAGMEDREAAIALFKQSYQPAWPGTVAWNSYVDATIAFMARDKPGLLRARENLLQVNPPAEYVVKDGRFEVEM